LTNAIRVATVGIRPGIIPSAEAYVAPQSIHEIDTAPARGVLAVRLVGRPFLAEQLFQRILAFIWVKYLPLNLELDFKTKHALQHPLQQHKQKQKILRRGRGIIESYREGEVD
jgi:hypothetical protein